MLYLTRRARVGHDTIWIGDDIRVVIRRVDGEQVRVGIDAPDNVNIVREEIKPTEKTV